MSTAAAVPARIAARDFVTDIAQKCVALPARKKSSAGSHRSQSRAGQPVTSQQPRKAGRVIRRRTAPSFGAERPKEGAIARPEPDPPVPPDRDVPPIEEPPDNPDVQPNAPVREPEPPGPTRL